MSANLIRSKSTDIQNIKFLVSYLKLLLRVSGVTFLMLAIIFAASKKSQLSLAQNSQPANSSQNTQRGSIKEKSSTFNLNQIQYLNLSQESSEEDNEPKSQVSPKSSVEKNKLKSQAPPVTVDEFINLEQESSEKADELKPQASLVTIDKFISLEQEFSEKANELKSQTSPTSTDEPINLEEQESSEELEEQESSEELEEQESSEEDAKEKLPVMFGDKGSSRWYIQTGAGFDIESENNGSFGLAGVGVSHFFINGHSINLELNGLGFLQDNDDAVGANLALIMRWHVLRKPNWSLYIDGGAGLIGTTNNVPSSGSSFNFTPQVGGGATIRISEKKHLMFGLRWHHISNAELFEGNPGLDSLMGYVGLNLPF